MPPLIFLDLNRTYAKERAVGAIHELPLRLVLLRKDNNSTHKQKMKRLLADNLKAAEIDDKILVEFIHTLLTRPHLILPSMKSIFYD